MRIGILSYLEEQKPQTGAVACAATNALPAFHSLYLDLGGGMFYTHLRSCP